MIVPQNKLLILFAAIVLPASLIGAFYPAGLEPAAGVVVLFALTAGIDALLARLAFEGMAISFPAIVRLSKNKKGNIEFQIKNAKGGKRLVRIGLARPEQLIFDGDPFAAAVETAEEPLRFVWPCTGLARGRYRFDKCYLETSSTFALWSVRVCRAIDMEVRVYPNLARERKTLAALFLNRGLYGIHAHRQVGQGREFEKLREYIHGDSYDQISWKATARRSRPVTKVFQIEKTQEVYLIVDASRLSARNGKAPASGESQTADGSPETILESFVNTALMMGLVAERQGDLFGLISFDDRVRSFIKAGSGKAHFNVCRDALYALEPQTVSPDYNDLFTFIGQRLRRRALLIFLTSLDDPVLAESFMHKLGLIDRKHLVLVNMLRPAGVRSLFSRSDIVSTDDIYSDLGGHITLQGLGEIQKMLHLRGVNFTVLSHEIFCADIVSQYVSVKQRQLI